MKLETKSSENHRSLFVKFKLPFFPKSFQLSTVFYNEPCVWVHGYSSRTKSGRYVLFHDYDNLDLASVVYELKWLQRKFNLSNYYIFKLDRENSFHAVCLDTFSLAKAFDIQKTTSCDMAFINSIKRLETKEWILRWDSKGDRAAPEFYTAVVSKNNKHVKSSAHAAFLRKLEVSVPKKGPWDGFKKLALVDYNTANRTKPAGVV